MFIKSCLLCNKMNESNNYGEEWKILDKKESVLYDSVYIKYKNLQNKLMVIEVRIVTFKEDDDFEWRCWGHLELKTLSCSESEYMSKFSLWKFTEVCTYDFCTFGIYITLFKNYLKNAMCLEINKNVSK